MSADLTTIQLFYANWKEYMGMLKAALAPLTPEQLTLRVAPHERTIGEIAAHIVAGRIYWFHDFLGEGGEEFDPYLTWDRANAPSTITLAELLEGFDVSWNLMAGLLASWTPTDMQKTFPDEWEGQHYDTPRNWVLWHILQHDLIHGGEISLTLGVHGLEAPRL